MSNSALRANAHPLPDRLWFTRCPVPTATGLAYKLGWLGEEFAADGIALDTLQETPEQSLRRHHYDHQLPALIREGGNVLALAARAQGAPSRLIGLTWIDEWQSILVRPDSGISEPKQLAGRRLALPDYSDNPIPDHVRGTSIGRAMSLHGYLGALNHAGLTLNDVELVEVPSGRYGDNRRDTPIGEGRTSWALQALVEGRVDAVYVKGAAAVDAAKRHGVVVGIDLDRLPERRFRVNNGTPRPITVHESLLEDHFELVVRFLYQTLRAAEWAKDNLGGVQAVLEGETRGSAAAVAAAYGEGFHRALHPDLSEERLALFEVQKKFLWLHGFQEHDFDFADWVDPRPLAAAWERLRAEQR